MHEILHNTKKKENPFVWVQQCLWAIGATVLLLSPACFIKVNSVPHNDNSYNQAIPIVALPSFDSTFAKESNAIKNIYAWAELKDPDLTLKPNEKLGFAKFLPDIPNFNYYFIPEYTIPQTEYNPLPVSKLTFSPDDSSIRYVLKVNWTPKIHIHIPEIPEKSKPLEILWRNLQGQLLLDPPEIDLDSAKKICKQINSITEIEIIPDTPEPRLVIRKSCNVSQLDMLALNALRTTVNAHVIARRFNASLPQIPSISLQVLWRIN